MDKNILKSQIESIDINIIKNQRLILQYIGSIKKDENKVYDLTSAQLNNLIDDTKKLQSELHYLYSKLYSI